MVSIGTIGSTHRPRTEALSTRSQAAGGPHDSVDLSGSLDVDPMLKVVRSRLTPSANDAHANIGEPMLSTQGLVMPPGGTQARHDVPVVVVHGTMADSASISKYENPIASGGHPVDLETYQSIKDGRSLQESGKILSRNINDDRMAIAHQHLTRLRECKGDLTQIKQVLGIDPSLYPEADPSADKLAALVPGLINRLDGLMQGDLDTLRNNFSLNVKHLEEDLTKQVAATGFAGDVRDPKLRGELQQKCATELMDCIAPRAVLLGHSMGGFVSYVVALNPTTDATKNDEFAYDAGNGVSSVILMSSPVKDGTRNPLPPGIANYMYDNYNKTVLAPVEQTPGMQLALGNPAFAYWYEMQKEMTRATWALSSNATTALTAPLIHMKKPGVGQVAEGSEFMQKYVKGKEIPYGVTTFSFTNKMDGVAEADRCQLDDRQVNAFNVDTKVQLPPEKLAKPGFTPAVLAHFMMGQLPFEHATECRQQIYENPTFIPRLLNPKNDDGIRWRTLLTLRENLQKDPQLLEKPGMEHVLASVQTVAAERIPFKDAPSAVAQQILNDLEKA